MTCCAEERVLTDCHSVADDDLVYAIAVDLMAQTTAGSHGQVPWCPYSCTWVGVCSRSNLRSEYMKQESAPAVQRHRTRSIQQQPYQLPDDPAQLVVKRQFRRHEARTPRHLRRVVHSKCPPTQVWPASRHADDDHRYRTDSAGNGPVHPLRWHKPLRPW